MNTDNKTILRGFLSSIFCVVHRVCRAQERSACTMYRQAAVCAKRASRGARNQQGTEIRVRIWPTERNATYLVSMESGMFGDFYSTNSKFADDRWNWKERQYLQNNIRQTNNLDLTMKVSWLCHELIIWRKIPCRVCVVWPSRGFRRPHGAFFRGNWLVVLASGGRCRPVTCCCEHCSVDRGDFVPTVPVQWWVVHTYF